jgi:hypothetical protein
MTRANSTVCSIVSKSLILQVTCVSAGRFLLKVVRMSCTVSGFFRSAEPAPLAVENFSGHPMFISIAATSLTATIALCSARVASPVPNCITSRFFSCEIRSREISQFFCGRRRRVLADGMSDLFSPGFSGSSAHLRNSLEHHCRVIVGGIRIDKVHSTPCRVLHSFDLHHPGGERNGGKVRRGSRAHMSVGSGSPPSPRMHFDRFLGHLLAIDELL